MSSVLDDIKKRRTRQSVGEQPAAAPVEPVAPAAQPMGDQANARVYQGENGNVKTENGLNPTAEQKATAMMLVNPALTTPQAEPAEPAAPKQMTYTDLYRSINPGMTPEEKAAQQKRQRNRQIINAVGDGISALANLYYTNKSGVNAYDPSTSLTKAAKERYDKLLAQQREDEERYKELAYRSGAADIEMAYRRAKDAAADKRAEDEAGYKKRKEDREVAESNAKIKTEEAHQRYYDAYADYYNSGGKKTSGGGSSVNRDVYIIQDDGTKKMFKHSENANNIQAAYAELPKEFKAQKEVKLYNKDRRGRSVLRVDAEGVPVTKLVENTKPTLGEMRQAIEEYNARELKNDGAVTGSTNASPLNKGKMSNNNKDTGSW